MKSDLAERLLQALMDWDVPRFSDEVGRLQMLASIKYDEYGGYRPGVKFAENLARWLEQFQPGERDIAYEFLRDRLIFISDMEMNHLIEIAYPDFIEQEFLSRVAAETGTSRTRVRALKESREFQSIRRRSLFLGLSDGARLDRLRRACGLSHEQFNQDYNIADDQAERMQDELRKALDLQELPGEPMFQHVFLVDDFSGSGRTIVRTDAKGKGKGKCVRFLERLSALVDADIVTPDAKTTLLLYVASEQARDHITEELARSGLEGWELLIVQEISRGHRVDRTDPQMADLCREYFDPATIDEYKDRVPIGYSDCALPLVLAHNTPNNSVSLLWSESPEESDLARRALFPRYERHHRDRP